MEIGNLIFGNSRGNYEVPRELVNSKSWNNLSMPIKKTPTSISRR